MKTTHTEIFKLNVPLKEPFVISLGPITDANNIAVKIHTDTRVAGTGECSPFTTIVGETQATEFELAKDIAGLIKGKDPLAIEERLAEIDAALPGNTTVKSAFDMALYDLLARHAGLPLYRLLGGGNTRRVFTDMTVGLGTAEQMAAQARKFKEAGFPAIKVKLGTSPTDDVERIRAIRKAVGDKIPLRIDANQGWDPLTAIQTLKALEPFGIDHCEEPVPHWDNRGLARVTANSPIPIMADESVFDHRDAFRLAAMGACDYFNVKLSKSGGIHNALKIIAVAEAAGMKCQVGCMSETRFALTALTHLAAARRNIVHFDIDSCLMHVTDPVVGGIEYKGYGEWVLPEAPGIGADFDPAFLNRMEKTTV
jgi:L-alanine-DL-glutamate epimerase-like enolase superfamily enzyme